MTKGKIAAQVAHAAVTSVIEVLESKNSEWQAWLKCWLEQGQKKVVLKVENLDKLLKLVEEAKKLHLPVAIIRDAGRTELEPGTITCAAIGPGPAPIIDRVTGRLKLL
ncbi:MAG TPA: peptidyl-tRNA hydrolase [Pyrodictiaceae archaeon]|nr:peptidyl-tRNA hydrolase [Pyrodictiaceae archaeon]HIQ10770.1 peptidyl-tRNA hydrolase [Pyrodictium sp.]HIQ55077.1 peptidyl-tRNA hydrolase [Pyrodictium sp.]